MGEVVLLPVVVHESEGFREQEFKRALAERPFRRRRRVPIQQSLLAEDDLVPPEFEGEQ